MAYESEIKRIRSLTDGAEDMTDVEIEAELASGKTIREICYDYWTAKATSYSSLVNVSESGSSRNMGDLYKNALAISDRFAPLEQQSGSRQKRSRAAVRG